MKIKTIFCVLMFALFSEHLFGAQAPIWKTETPYVLQVKTVETADEAVKLVEKLDGIDGHRVYYAETTVNNKKWYQVRIANFQSERLAREKGEILVREKVIDDFFTITDELTYMIINYRGIGVKEILTRFFNDTGNKLPVLEFNLANYAKDSFSRKQAAQNNIYLSENNEKWGKGNPIYWISESYVLDMDGDTSLEIIFIFNKCYKFTLFPTSVLLAVVNVKGNGSFDICDQIFLEDINIMDAEEGHYYEISIVNTEKPEILITEKEWRIGSGTELNRRYRLIDKKLKLTSSE